MTSLDYLAVYLLVINILSSIVNIADKIAAKHNRWRTPERVLWAFALLGGATGSYITMQTIRHKTQKKYFKSIMPLLSILQILIFVFLIVSKYNTN